MKKYSKKFGKKRSLGRHGSRWEGNIKINLNKWDIKI
jgi:hypothetical protein